MKRYILSFNEIGIKDISQVGGKNASLGEMYRNLSASGVSVPDGFATTSYAYNEFLNKNNIRKKIESELASLDGNDLHELATVSENCKKLILSSLFSEGFKTELQKSMNSFCNAYGADIALAVRSSATAEDLPTASFAGQQESYLNIKGYELLLESIQKCYASLFNERAIKYRIEKGFDHMKVALSVGIQLMVNSDKASSGVMFTIDPDTGFDKTVVINGCWGLGENIVQGAIIPDEYIVFKPFIGKYTQPIISKKLGSKAITMIYSSKAEKTTENIATPLHLQNSYTLSDEEICMLANWGTVIEKYYKMPMDIEWAKDGLSNKLYIVQARPETIHGTKNKEIKYTEFKIIKKGSVVCKGIGIGNGVVTGRARILESPKDAFKIKQGDILVAPKTDPDWDPVLSIVSAVITEQGGRTSHAAIVARELGVIGIVGALGAISKIKDGQTITVSTVEGAEGVVYEGETLWQEKEIKTEALPETKTKPMLILAHPDLAYKYSKLPVHGVGLMRMEFIISNVIRIHPMALVRYDDLKDERLKNEIDEIVLPYKNKKKYFIEKLAQATATIAAAFYPREVIVRMSDFKSNEYAELVGGNIFEPKEENPMIGFRGASRYYHPIYKEGFELECDAMKLLRDEMGFDNVNIMIPFVRNLQEAQKVIDVMKERGLCRKKNKLKLYMMLEVPSNAILADDFAPYFDGFSIGSNDLTQLTLGVDRDSVLLKDVFTANDPAVRDLIKTSIEKAKRNNVTIGLCGQAPSDDPEYASFLVRCGIDSISFNPDAVIKGIENIAAAEKSK